MAKDYGTFECSWCGKVKKCKHPSVSYNKYCNSKCSGSHRAQQRIDGYLLEGNFTSKNKQLPIFIKQYIRNRDETCAVCNTREWNGSSIILEVDHIDGNYTNNSPDNLRALCPNCHSQTNTYKNRNRGNGRTLR